MSNSVPSVGPSQVVLEEIFENSAIPKLYSNSFAFGHNLTDITIVFQLVKTPLAAVIMDFTAAKTLYNSLGNIIQAVERGLGYEIKDLQGTMIEWLRNVSQNQPATLADNNQPNNQENEQQ